MYKKDKQAKVPYVWALFVKPKGSKRAVILVLNKSIPVFADKETTEDFYKTMVKGKIEAEDEIVIAPVVMEQYDPKKHDKKNN